MTRGKVTPANRFCLALPDSRSPRQHDLEVDGERDLHQSHELFTSNGARNYSIDREVHNRVQSQVDNNVDVIGSVVSADHSHLLNPDTKVRRASFEFRNEFYLSNALTALARCPTSWVFQHHTHTAYLSVILLQVLPLALFER